MNEGLGVKENNGQGSLGTKEEFGSGGLGSKDYNQTAFVSKQAYSPEEDRKEDGPGGDNDGAT